MGELDKRSMKKVVNKSNFLNQKTIDIDVQEEIKS